MLRIRQEPGLRLQKGEIPTDEQQVQEETGIDRGIDRGMDTLKDGGLVKYDDERNMVFVINMMKHQTQGCNLNEKQRAGVVNHFKKLHNTPLIQDFLEPKYSIWIVPLKALN